MGNRVRRESRGPNTDTGIGRQTGRWVLILICAILLFGSSPAFAGEFFPFSVWYSGGKARAPMLEPITDESREIWKKDLNQIKALGFNTVRTWVEWTANEPRLGEYDFSNLELLAELAEEAGLKLFVQVYTDSAPDWVGEQWADARFVAQSGEVVPSQSAPGYCFDHPEVQSKILTFYREAAKVAKRHDNFVGWDLWSEPHIINWAIIDYVPNATFCYCPSSMKRFRTWLEKRYGSLDGLNRAWYRTFTRWEQVEPPRFGTILSYTDYIDWRMFVQQKLAEDLKLKSDAVKSVDPTKVTTSHAAVPSLYTSPRWGVGAPDDWLMVESADYWGTSIYPKHSFPDRHWSLLTVTSLIDFVRSSGRSKKGFYVGELQAGMGIRGTIVGNPVTADDQRLWVLGMLSRGARAINVYAYYPMNSGYEAGGYGLINLDGSVTPRARAMGKLAKMVDENQELFLEAQPKKADVALIYNPLSYLVGGEQHLSSGSVVRDSLQGLYQAFWRKNIATDFLHLKDVAAGQLSGYKVAYLPYPLMLTADSAAQLKEFVRGGGTLVAEARCGWNDDRGYSQDLIPGFGLAEVFGVREGFLKMEDSVAISWKDSSGTVAGLEPGDQITGLGIIEQLLPQEGTESLAEFSDGSVAITRNRFGSGTAYLVGSFLGMANLKEVSETTERFFIGVAASAGVEPVMDVSGVGPEDIVEIRLLESSEGNLVYLFNHSEREAAVTLPIQDAVDLETGSGASLNPVKLSTGEIRIFRFN
ncbi:MAG: beta-galactosidase [Acidobacteriota bacterium]|nr:MAG: beta-galactosidase [Acidobacteriota bacterium]